jgi:hypothetical protein
MTTIARPDRGEAAEYYFTYINCVPENADVRRMLEDQLPETLAVLRGISEERSLHRYAPGKWSIRDVVCHLSDAERLFTFRALWFARGFSDALPSFEQDVAAEGARADDRSWRSHIDDFRAVRQSTLTLFRDLPPPAWERRGVASGVPVTVRALAWISAGHLAHHAAIIRDRYLPLL